MADRSERLRVLEEVSREMIVPRPIHDTLKIIVEKSMQLLDAEGGTIYLRGEEDAKELYFEVALNKFSNISYDRHLVKDTSLAYHTFQSATSLLLEDVYNIDPSLNLKFDDSFDRISGYKTRSILAQPFFNSKGETLGVIQLINKHGEDQLFFSEEDRSVLGSFASFAAAAIENASLRKNLENVFEGFVTASVSAIEARDPTTKGHSERVAHLTVDLAEKVDASHDSPIRSVVFTPAQISEIRYASLLHDFGKIGVREDVLQKEEKLSPYQKLEIRKRFDEFKMSAEIRVWRNYLNTLLSQNRAPTDLEYQRFEEQISKFNGRIEEFWEMVLDLNKPSVIDSEKSKKIDVLSTHSCETCEGHKQPLLEDKEILTLSIRRGSLDDAERREIESHVTFTYQFLRRIPWTSELKFVPDIAWAHHERLTGSGYPRRISGNAIPVQSRIMAICDVFDALVASDRPYKAALPLEKAIDILQDQVTNGHLDANLFKVFLEAKVFENKLFKELLPRNSFTKKKKVA